MLCVCSCSSDGLPFEEDRPGQPRFQPVECGVCSPKDTSEGWSRRGGRPPDLAGDCQVPGLSLFSTDTCFVGEEDTDGDDRLTALPEAGVDTDPFGPHIMTPKMSRNDHKDLFLAHGKLISGPSRCTAQDPFWVHSKAPRQEPNKDDGWLGLASLSPWRCLLEDAGALVEEDDVPESELMTVQLQTREQRLDWRDFLCETVAERKAATLFCLFDVEADPPEYARPPPSALPIGSADRPKCIAPDGAGWKRLQSLTVSKDRHRTRRVIEVQL